MTFDQINATILDLGVLITAISGCIAAFKGIDNNRIAKENIVVSRDTHAMVDGQKTATDHLIANLQGTVQTNAIDKAVADKVISDKTAGDAAIAAEKGKNV